MAGKLATPWLHFWLLRFLAFVFGFSHPLHPTSLEVGFLAFAAFAYACVYVCTASNIMVPPPNLPPGFQSFYRDKHAPFAESSLRTSWGGAAARPNSSLVFTFFFAETKAPFVESSLLRTSWGGGQPPPPQTPRWFLMFLRKLTHPWLNHRFFEHHGGQEINAPFAESAICVFMFVCVHFFEHDGAAPHPPPPPPTPPLVFTFVAEINTPFVKCSLLRVSWVGDIYLQTKNACRRGTDDAEDAGSQRIHNDTIW